ncbi:MAG: hypothetical protein LBF49_02645 [Puniceicoccales bacterium]|jgi:hypothetical protein|nr:hypothetical protein [Puniceicoccales bacterium]
MKKVERSLSAPYGLLSISSLKKDGGDPKIVDPIVAGSGEIGIPPPRIFGSPLEIRSAVVPTVPPLVIPLDSTLNPPMSCLELTLENTAGLTEDEILGVLSLNGRFDASKFEIVLFLPDGYQIAMQLVNGMSGGCLLKLFGESRASSENFVYHMISGKYLERKMEKFPTVKEMKEYLRVECGFFPEDLQDEEVDERITSLAQTMIGVYTNQDRRVEFEGERRNLNSLIINKFPLPDMENQACWNNIITQLKI